MAPRKEQKTTTRPRPHTPWASPEPLFSVRRRGGSWILVPEALQAWYFVDPKYDWEASIPKNQSSSTVVERHCGVWRALHTLFVRQRHWSVTFLAAPKPGQNRKSLSASRARRDHPPPTVTPGLMAWAKWHAADLSHHARVARRRARRARAHQPYI